MTEKEERGFETKLCGFYSNCCAAVLIIDPNWT